MAMTHVDDESCKVGDSSHDAGDDCPSQLGAACSGALLDHGSSTASSDECPDEERDTSSRRDDCLDGEEMANLVHREPDERKRTQPEKHKRDQVVDGASHGNRLCHFGALSKRWPDTGNHEVDAFTSDPSLNTIPNTVEMCQLFACLIRHASGYSPGHDDSVQHRPQGAPDTERSSVDNRERDVVSSTDSSGQDDEEGRDGVADPYTDPGLPPCQARLKRRGSNHPRVDVKTVSDPKADKVEGFPLATGWLNGLKIMVCKEEFFVTEAGLGLDFLCIGGRLVLGSPMCIRRVDKWRSMAALRASGRTGEGPLRNVNGAAAATSVV